MAAQVALRNERMINIAEGWLHGDKSYRPLRFLSGVESGIIGCEISQVNVVREDEKVQIVHIMSSVKPGAAQIAGLRPMDVLLEVDGNEVSGQSIEIVREHLVKASETHQGEFTLTIGRILEGDERPDGWGQYFDHNHMKYYYNAETLQSSWTVPTVELPKGWKKIRDAEGAILYENDESGEKTETRPVLEIDENAQPVLVAAWVNKRRSGNSAWRLRWLTILRNGTLSWGKSMADEPLGTCSLAHSSFVAGLGHDGKGANVKETYTISLKFEIPDQKGQDTMELSCESADISEKIQVALTTAKANAEDSDDLHEHYGNAGRSASQKSLAKASTAKENAKWKAASGSRLSFDRDQEYDEAPYNAKIDMQGWFKKKGSFVKSMKNRYALLQGRNIRYFEDDNAAARFHQETGKGYKGDVVVTGVLKTGQFLNAESYSLHLSLAGIGGKGKVLELEFDEEGLRDKWLSAVNKACGVQSGSSDAVGDGQSSNTMQRRITAMGMAKRKTTLN